MHAKHHIQRSIVSVLFICLLATLVLPFQLRAASQTFTLAAGDKLTVTCDTKLTGSIEGGKSVLTCAPKATNTVLKQLKGIEEGQTLSGRTVIQAIVADKTKVAQVTFNLEGPKSMTHTEKFFPYYFNGDSKGKPIGWDAGSFPSGQYSLSVVVTDRNGKKSPASMVSFSVQGTSPTATAEPTTDPTEEPTADPSDPTTTPTDPTPQPTEEPSSGTVAENCSPKLQELINSAASGSTVNVPACIYRESVTVNKPLTLIAAAGAEIRGSDVWNNWSQQGSTWMSDKSVPSFTTHGDCKRNTSRCKWPEQVFIDLKPLVQVASNPGAGQFAVNSSRKVILGENPAGRKVEVTTRTSWLAGGADNVTIQGFRMRHAANDSQSGALTTRSRSNWIIQDNVLSDTHGGVLSIGRSNTSKVLRNDIFRGGQLGIHGSGGTSNLIQANKIHHNNTEDFLVAWEGGGFKITHAYKMVVDGNEAYNNNGPGLWCDIDCKDVTYSNNRIHHNANSGIWFEISDGAKIYGNVAWENGWGYSTWGWGAGILIASSKNAEVYNNTTAWNADGIVVLSQNRGETRWNQSTGNNVHDNKVIQSNTGYALGWLQDWSGILFNGASQNRGTANAYWYNVGEGSGGRFAWSRDFQRLAEFKQTVNDTTSRYLTTQEKDQTLRDANLPMAPER